jgi:hypothetical protein
MNQMVGDGLLIAINVQILQVVRKVSKRHLDVDGARDIQVVEISVREGQVGLGPVVEKSKICRSVDFMTYPINESIAEIVGSNLQQLLWPRTCQLG